MCQTKKLKKLIIQMKETMIALTISITIVAKMTLMINSEPNPDTYVELDEEEDD